MGNEPYELVTEIPIGGEGGWDILTIDSTAQRLYLSHATKVVVVDLGKNAVVGEIADTPGVHAILGRAGSAARFFIQWKGKQSERGRFENAEHYFKG